MSSLPLYLLSAWRLQHGDEEQAKKADQLKGWTASSLAETYMRYQLDLHVGSRHHERHTSTLSSTAAGKIIDVLQSSSDLHKDVKVIAASLSWTALRQLLEDPRVSYQALRVFNALPQTMFGKTRRIVDIDEAVLMNEHYIRSRGSSNTDGSYLVSLADLVSIVSSTSTYSKSPEPSILFDEETITFTRKDPPKGGLEVLDYWRPRQLSINSNNAAFGKVFDRITRGILRGLDWRNVIIAGGMVLTTLLHTDLARDYEKAVQDPDIDVYIHGLGPMDANRKVEEIYNSWVRNLPPSASRKLVVKNAKTINFLADYPIRRIQIVLKLLPTPTDILLNFDLDACAIGFDGSRVFMLPRCARAIETGYSVFTMDLVWGHHLGDRRASQDSRIFKYADRGFGIRFLPSYARSLGEESLEPPTSHTAAPPTVAEEVSQADRRNRYFRWSQRNRKPNGKEPGLKTLRRIEYLGQDYVHRFYYGPSPLSLSPSRLQSQLQAQGLDDPSNGDDLDEDEIGRELEGEGDDLCEYPVIMFTDLDTSRLQTGLPDGRRGLGNLEIFMRHCEAWRLNACGKAS